jgi:hypothetical protein
MGRLNQVVPSGNGGGAGVSPVRAPQDPQRTDTTLGGGEPSEAGNVSFPPAKGTLRFQPGNREPAWEQGAWGKQWTRLT